MLNRLPVRVRLTFWYLAVLVITFALISVGLLLALRSSVHQAVDEELTTRLQGVHTFLWRHLPWQSGSELLQEFREHSGLRPGGDLYQVNDKDGAWVFQSPSMRDMHLPVELPASLRGSHFETVERFENYYRVLTARIEVAHKFYTIQVASVVTPFYTVLARFEWLAFLIVPVVLALSGVGGYWLSGRAMRPVGEITRTAQSISAQSLSKRLSVPGAKDELRLLSETLNGMLSRLEHTFRHIVQFTADASHELRTPVAIIRTAVEYIQQKERSVSEYQEANSQILAEAERVSKLLEDLMELARADSDVTQFSFEPFDLAAAIREASSGMRALAEAKNLSFVVHLSSPRIIVSGDPQAIRRLLIILIDNAIKYTEASGSVVVSAEVDYGAVRIEVADSGIGIPSEDLPHIFERFYRVDKVRSREMGGAGLGLSIARWIADAHRGRIEVNSTLGSGSVFSVILPLDEKLANHAIRPSSAKSISQA